MWFLIFLSERVWIIFYSGVNFDLPKVSKQLSILNWSKQQNDQFENLYISSRGKARNIKFGQQVNFIEKVPFGTPSQEVTTSLPHNHMTFTNPFISSYRGQCYQIWAVKTTPWQKSKEHFLGVLPIEPTGATFIHTNTEVVISFLLQIFCDNKIQQLLQKTQMLLWQLTSLEALVFEHETS